MAGAGDPLPPGNAIAIGVEGLAGTDNAGGTWAWFQPGKSIHRLARFIDIDRRRISDRTLREIGKFEVPVRMGTDLAPNVHVIILREEDVEKYLAGQQVDVPVHAAEEYIEVEETVEEVAEEAAEADAQGSPALMRVA